MTDVMVMMTVMMMMMLMVNMMMMEVSWYNEEGNDDGCGGEGSKSERSSQAPRSYFFLEPD